MHDLLDRPIAFQRPFVELGVGVTGALMLSQAVYWSKRTRDADGWFYKTQEEWQEETGLTRSEYETARKRLIAAGVLSEKKKGVPCRLFFRVEMDALAANLLAGIQQASTQEPCNPVCGNPANKGAGNLQAITETTAETTHQEHCADAQPSPSVVFDGTDFIVSEALIAKWGKAFPGVNIELEVERASVWAAGNAPKKDWQRFLSNWMSKKGGNGVDETGVPVDQIIDLYHRTCPNLPRVTVAADKTLRGMIVDRWNEAADHQSGKDFWLPFFRKANSRSQVFYRGQQIVPRLEALVSRAVFREIAEGKA